MSCTIHSYHVFKHMSQAYSFLTYTFLVHIRCSHIMFNAIHMSSFIHVLLNIHIITHIHALYIFLNQCYHYLSVHTIFSMVITLHHIVTLYQIIPFMSSYIIHVTYQSLYIIHVHVMLKYQASKDHIYRYINSYIHVNYVTYT